MKKIDLGQAVTILANIGVIAGIVFLAIEIRLNTRSLDEARNLAIAQASQEMAAQLDDSFRSLANSEQLPGIFVKYETEGFEALDPEERRRFVWQSCSGLARIDTIHSWWERGYVSEEEYDERIRRLVVDFAPRWQAIGIAPMRPAFRAEAERILLEANSPFELPETSAC